MHAEYSIRYVLFFNVFDISKCDGTDKYFPL